METLPYELKLTYIIAVFIVMLFVAFLIMVVFIYNRKQLFYLKEKQLRDSEHKNQLLQKELERQKDIQKERERISHDMHDDLGAGISAMKLQAEYLKTKSKDQETITDIDDLLKTSEDMNTSMREILWTLNSSNDNLRNFVQYATTYAENFFRKTRIKIRIQTTEISEKELTAEVRRNFFLCFKEALNNVYKHSNAENVYIFFTEEEKHFTIEIIDDGIGLNANSEKGNGMENMKKRMQDCKGNFKILDSEKGLNLLLKIEWD